MMEEQQRLLVEVLDLFALRFDKHAVLRGGMVLRILGCERLTNDLDYVFVPYRSKKDIAGDVLEALRSLAGVTISHTLNSKCLRVSISRGDVAIQVEAKTALDVSARTLSTGSLARLFNLPPRLIRVVDYPVALADKMAAWNERRLMRDLYDIWFFLRMGVRPDAATLLRRLQKPEYSRLVKAPEHFKGKTIEDFHGFLRAHANPLSDEAIAEELKDFLRADELAGLSMRFRAEFAKL
ncbi:MAG TPA: nucleotidyl transferase AbiEii/AbiGii toxin family protein [Kiritimatiellia bacterium]|jgi:predicted nucleotidyltransferase component of viral defense system|nr:nucleotidyl transferase AbiEii/AbiGii toxin family protein [Kiritimatiellia bacterium]